MRNFIKLLMIIFVVTGLFCYIENDKIIYTKNSLFYVVNKFILKKEYLVATTKDGLKFKFKTADAVGRAIYKDRNYESEITQFVLNEIKYNSTDIVIDVGANIGWYSVLLGNKKNGPGIIYAFEPDPLNYSLLTTNLALNNISNVITINSALSNKAGKASLYKYGDKNLGKHSLLPLFNGKVETITTTTLDKFIAKNHIASKNVKLIKIDVEGFEGSVLQGATELLSTVKYVLLEFSPEFMQKGNVSPQQLIDLLLQTNFKPYRIISSKATPITEPLLSLPNGTNILWKKSGVID